MDATAEPGAGTPAEGRPEADRSRSLSRRILALVAWTVLVWGTRIDNIVGDDGLSAAGKAIRLALAGSLLVLAVLAGTEWWAARRRPTTPSGFRAKIVPLAVWTTLVWAVRATGIALGDHDAAFISVHLVLAVVSIALVAAVLAARPALPGTEGPALP